MVPTRQFLDALRAAVRDELAALKGVVRQVVREELETAFHELGKRHAERDAGVDLMLANVRSALELSVTRNAEVERLAQRVLNQSEILARLAGTGV
jgi:hypothetical protein